MSAILPIVSAHWLYDPAQGGAPIRLDTPAWTAWLDAPPSTRFAYPVFAATCGYIVGRLTVRKERAQRGGAYWVAYRRWGGRLRKVYLGHASAVTQARLEAATQVLRPPSQLLSDAAGADQVLLT
jgi:LuxR family maltose regulon positive regulatory protein